MRTYIYVDGFNLYYCALKNTPYKWLNIKTLCSLLLKPENDIRAIKYYSARVSDIIKNGTAGRQQRYVRALHTIPEVNIHWGNFLSHPVRMPLAKPTTHERMATVIKTEEKGSDVNLASHLINDAWKDEYDVAVVISNDTDLVEPMRIVRHEIGKTLGVICPAQRVAYSIKNIPPSFIRMIKPDDLRKAQFPDRIPGTDIKKPFKW